MASKLRNSAAAILLLLCAAHSVLAGSVTQPGDTMGRATAPIPPGFYATNQANTGCLSTTPRTCITAEVPLLAWSTPWTILGGRLLFATGPTTVVNATIRHTYHANGLFNPFLAGQLAWELGDGWNFAYMLGAYFTVGGPVAYSSNSLNQRFGLSYTADGWDLTANAIWGINFEQTSTKPQGSPCPATPAVACNPNFLNVDLTGTKQFDKWELGPIGLYAADISTPMAGYPRQSKFAMGGLVGYSFDPVVLQVYVTHDVYEKNYGGRDTRLWTRLSIPLGNPPPPPGVRPFTY